MLNILRLNDYPKKMFHLDFFAGEIKLKTIVNITAPRIDQITGYFIPRITGDQICGKSNSLPSHVPIKAPTKPTIADKIHPPLSKPTSERAIEPVIAAITNIIKKSSNDILVPLLVYLKLSYLRANINFFGRFSSSTDNSVTFILHC